MNEHNKQVTLERDVAEFDLLIEKAFRRNVVVQPNKEWLVT